MKYSLLILFLCSIVTIQAQDKKSNNVFDTFKDRRVINSHSVETLQKRQLDIRIAHRFGDLAGDNGGWDNFYGLENAADVLIGAEYGATDNLTVGLFRTKGAANFNAIINGQAKYRILRQKEEGMPVTLSVLGFTGVSTAKKGDDPEQLNFYDETAHRFVHGAQILLARKFSNLFSLQISPSFIHRNVVLFGEENNIISIGAATRIQLTKVIGILADVNLPISGLQDKGDATIPFGLGFEFDTGGHVFQLNFTNTKGLSAVDYIPNTTSKWGDGEFRMGFTISRLFNL
ncbi:MAG: hypothetical protein ACI8YQ_000141 [Polaribacter sp.]|jgi:hypothetical protein